MKVEPRGELGKELGNLRIQTVPGTRELGALAAKKSALAFEAPTARADKRGFRSFGSASIGALQHGGLGAAQKIKKILVEVLIAWPEATLLQDAVELRGVTFKHAEPPAR